MTHFNIYGKYEPTLNIILDNIISQIKTYNDMEVQKSGEKAYEHLIYRVKDKDSMLEKCTRKNLPQTTYSALHDIQDAIGIRIICRFIDDIYKNIDYLKSLPNLKIIKEKDYIKNVKAGFVLYRRAGRLSLHRGRERERQKHAGQGAARPQGPAFRPDCV